MNQAFPSSNTHLTLDKTTVIIRPAVSADQPAIYDLVETIYQEFHFDLYENHRHSDLHDLQESYPEPQAQFWVCVDTNLASKDQIIGTAGVRPLPHRLKDQPHYITAELRRFYLKPGYRQMGLGQVLHEVVMSHAQDAGYDQIVLESHTSLGAAVAFYRKAGFKEIPCYAGEPEHYSNIAFAYNLVTK